MIIIGTPFYYCLYLVAEITDTVEGSSHTYWLASYQDDYGGL